MHLLRIMCASIANYKRLHANAFSLSGRTSSLHHTQGDALGYVLVAPSGRIMNVGAYSAVRAGFLEGGVEIDVKKSDYLLE